MLRVTEYSAFLDQFSIFKVDIIFISLGLVTKEAFAELREAGVFEELAKAGTPSVAAWTLAAAIEEKKVILPVTAYAACVAGGEVRKVERRLKATHAQLVSRHDELERLRLELATARERGDATRVAELEARQEADAASELQRDHRVRPRGRRRLYRCSLRHRLPAHHRRFHRHEAAAHKIDPARPLPATH